MKNKKQKSYSKVIINNYKILKKKKLHKKIIAEKNINLICIYSLLSVYN